jgi:hypothetical protein|tara:strand:- start:139 stop:477 length:339 start_codon:yes stop_codon:yes gene_type:complete
MTKQLDDTSDQDMAQDASQVMSKLDENRMKRAEIEKFLNEKKLANLHDQNIFNNQSKIYFKTAEEEAGGEPDSFQGPISLKDLYRINQEFGRSKNPANNKANQMNSDLRSVN